MKTCSASSPSPRKTAPGRNAVQGTSFDGKVHGDPEPDDAEPDSDGERRQEADRVRRVGAHPARRPCGGEEHDRGRDDESHRSRQIPERGRRNPPRCGVNEVKRAQQAVAEPEKQNDAGEDEPPAPRLGLLRGVRDGRGERSRHSGAPRIAGDVCPRGRREPQPSGEKDGDREHPEEEAVREPPAEHTPSDLLVAQDPGKADLDRRVLRALRLEPGPQRKAAVAHRSLRRSFLERVFGRRQELASFRGNLISYGL